MVDYEDPVCISVQKSGRIGQKQRDSSTIDPLQHVCIYIFPGIRLTSSKLFFHIFFSRPSMFPAFTSRSSNFSKTKKMNKKKEANLLCLGTLF